MLGSVHTAWVRLAARPEGGDAGGSGAVRPGILKVMIVEDEVLVAWHLEGLLEGLGHEVVCIAPSAEAAEAEFRAFEPDLVFMDVNLGQGPNGIEAARRLLAHRATPLVFVTAYGDARTRAAIAEVAPGGAVLSKPVTPAELERGIEAALGKRH